MKEEDVKGFDMALKMVGVKLNEAALELFIRTYEDYKLKGQEFSVRDAASIRAMLQEKHTHKRIEVSFEI